MSTPKATVSFHIDAHVKQEILNEAVNLSLVLGVKVNFATMLRLILEHRKEIKIIYDKLEMK